MFDSGISANNFINQITDEIDIANPFPLSVYVDCINAVEQLLYSEIIREQAEKEVTILSVPYDGHYTTELSSFSVGEHEAPIQYEDIYCVFTRGAYDSDYKQLIETTLTSCGIFPDSYCKDGGKLRINPSQKPQTLKFTYFVRPVIRTNSEDGTVTGGNIHLPVQFMDLISAKVRGEIYMLAAEYAHAANWLGIYNAQLENFKAYISQRTPSFGL